MFVTLKVFELEVGIDQSGLVYFWNTIFFFISQIQPW